MDYLKPDFFFGRDLEDTGGSRDWIIYHKSIGGTGRLKFTTGTTKRTSSAHFSGYFTNEQFDYGWNQ